MPTLTWLDSFEHQQTAQTFYGTLAGIYDTGNNTAKMSFVAGRLPGSHALQVVEDGALAARVNKAPPATTRTTVESFYIKVSAKPSVDSHFWVGVATINNFVGIASATGFVYGQVAGGTQRNDNVDISDGLWHRIDIKLVTSGTGYTLDVQVDGRALTQATNTSTAADITAIHLGSTVATHTLTVAFDGYVRSATATDYPIGPHRVLALVPVADGAHSWSSTNMGPASGGVASSVSTLWQSVDEWPASATDFIQYANTVATAAEYAEIVMQDVDTGTNVWAARAVAAILSAGTTANSATTRVVDAANATKLDLYVGDQSDTTMRHQASMIPSVTDVGILNGLKWRVGFPTDSNPAPEWAALLIEYAQAEPSYSRKPMSEPLPLIPRGRSM